MCVCGGGGGVDRCSIRTHVWVYVLGWVGVFKRMETASVMLKQVNSLYQGTLAYLNSLTEQPDNLNGKFYQILVMITGACAIR